MSFIQENVIQINLNLKNKYTLVHFSDVHIVAFPENTQQEAYAKASQNEKAWFRVRKEFADYFKEVCNEEQMIPSTQCLDHLLEYTCFIQPDLLMMSGDILDYDSPDNIYYLTNKLQNVSFPYVIACGNHESAKIFQELTNHHETFMVQHLKEFKVIAVDNSTKKFSAEQVTLLKEELKENCPILLCMHIPLMTQYNQEDMKKYDSYFIINHQDCDVNTKEFIDLILNHDLIKHVFCGHTHGQGFSQLCEHKNKYCASSGLIGYVNKIIIQ